MEKERKPRDRFWSSRVRGEGGVGERRRSKKKGGGSLFPPHPAKGTPVFLSSARAQQSGFRAPIHSFHTQECSVLAVK